MNINTQYNYILRPQNLLYSAIGSNFLSFGTRQSLAADKVEIKNKPASYKNTVLQVATAIKKAKRVAIVTHSGPDGDAMGSANALKDMLKQLKNIKHVEVLISGEVPEGIILGDQEGTKLIKKNDQNSVLDEKFDLVIAVDTAKKSLLKNTIPVFDAVKNTIRIDHHEDGDNFAQINLVKEKSSASMVVMDLIKPLGVKLTKDIASNLYLGLVTDTGGFRHISEPIAVFDFCKKLAKTGIDVEEIYSKSMDRITKPLVEFYGKVLQNVQYTNDGSIAYFIEDKKCKESDEVRLRNNKAGVTDVLRKIGANVLSNIKGVKVSIMAREVPEGTRLSLRGNDITVNDIAKHFGGGGHPDSACCILPQKPDEAVNEVIKALQEKMKAQKASI